MVTTNRDNLKGDKWTTIVSTVSIVATLHMSLYKLMERM